MPQKNAKNTWNLKLLFKNDTDPAIPRELRRARRQSYRFINKWQKRSDYLKDTKAARRALDEYNEWLTGTGTVGKVGYYFGLRLSQENNNPKLKAAMAKVRDQSREIGNGMEFFTNRLAKVPPAIQKKFLTSPTLKPYHYFLKDLFKNAEHLLSEAEEKIVSLKGGPAHGDWTRMVSNLLAQETWVVKGEDGKKTPRTVQELITLSTSRQKKVRDEAARGLNAILDKRAEVAEYELNAILDNKKTTDALRGFKRPDQSRHLGDDIETATVDAMLRAVEKRFPLARRFYALKAKALGLKKLAYHERNVPVGTADQNYSYSQATALVEKTLAGLDQEFGEIFERFLKNGQIDVYPKAGRSGGAFCTHNLPALPTYILLNHTNKLRDVITLAHEVGHGINNELMKTAQPAIYFGTSLATAEVASTFIEDFVFDHLRQETSPKARFALQMEKLNDDISTIFRQVACYRFEQALHTAFRQEGYLSKEKIGQIFQKNMSAYMGPAVSQDPGSENWWVYWSHIRNFFYVYSYASGLLISKSLQALVREDKNNIAKVKKFLAAGTSDSPQNIFQRTGINIADERFWNRGLQEIEALLTATEQLYRQINSR